MSDETSRNIQYCCQTNIQLYSMLEDTNDECVALLDNSIIIDNLFGNLALVPSMI